MNKIDWNMFYREYSIIDVKAKENPHAYLRYRGVDHAISTGESDIELALPWLQFNRLAEVCVSQLKEEDLRQKHPGLADIYSKYKAMLVLITQES
jgi:hypothetical protein